MKKILALVLALALTLSLIGAACAETRTYFLAALLDTEGNEVASITEEGKILTAAGEDITDQFPALVLYMDDEANTCIFGTEEETVQGTITVGEAAEGNVQLMLNLEGEEIEVVYMGEQDACAIYDEEHALFLVLARYN